MGGDHCAIVSCTADRRRCKGLSFCSIPKRGQKNEALDAWRGKLIQIINRSDKGFNPDTAVICSSHFEDACFKTGPSGRRMLVSGSIPTRFLPQKSLVTPTPLPRKLPAVRDAPPEVERVAYFTFDEVKKDLNLPAPWCLIAVSQDQVVVGCLQEQSSMLKFRVAFQSDFFTNVQV